MSSLKNLRKIIYPNNDVHLSFYMSFTLASLVLSSVNNLMFPFQFLYLVMASMLQLPCEQKYWST